MDFPKTSISLNLLSLSGYICLIILLYSGVETIYLQAYATEYFDSTGVRFLLRWLYLFFVQLILVLFAMTEFILCKKNKLPKMPAVISKYQSYLFRFGIFLIFIPVYLYISGSLVIWWHNHTYAT